MRKMIWSALLVMAILALVATVGCKEKVPATELEKLMARTSELDGQALQDTLRTYMGEGKPSAVYANFILGNWFYSAASDSAAITGWGGEGANALLDSAETYMVRSVVLDSTFVEGYVNLGALWDDRSEQMSSRDVRDQRLAAAEMNYQKALEIDPFNEKARCNLGSLYLRQKKTDQALKEFEGVLDHDPHSALAHYNLAIMFAEAKIYREAENEWELASKYDPDGDIGDRSRANIKIVGDLMNATVPDNLKQ
ncbi:hypothetical protein CO151_13310 [bacterium CG_4_9_14_3_um_filter_65_15]|nr:MAG: hypothetical protein CO151_13310 [bacterium CG_4_9_14_3_um_filter_65_15]